MIKKESIKKINVILIFLILFQMVANLFVVNAASIGEEKNLERGELGDYTVQYNNGSQWVYISYNIVTYKDESDINRIAYCITPNTPGVEWTAGSVAGYSVKLTETLSNATLWRAVRFGYPYATPSQLGVETDQDAYLATKLAIQCVLVGRPLEEVKTYYRAGQSPVAGLKLEDIQRRGTKVINAIYYLVDKAYNGTETPLNNNIVGINKIGNFELDNNNSNYYSQKFSVSSQTDISSYVVTSIYNFPEGSFCTDLNGNAKNNFSKGEQFKVLIPKEKINGSIDGEIFVTAKCKTYPIFFGDGPVGFQDYAVCCDPYGDVSATQVLKAQANTGKIQINKTDSETAEPIAGVKFELISSDNKVVGNATTDKNGKAIFNQLYPGNYKLKEISTNEDYVLDNTIIDINVEFDKTTIKDITNTKKKGKIKVIKVDLDNNEVKIPNVEFNIYDETGKVVDTLKTDVNGEAVSKELPINQNYKVQETKTGEWYILNEEPQTAVLKQNEITTLTFTNEKKKGKIKVIKVDADNKEIKIPDVEFKVYDESGKVVDTLKTNENGEAISKELPIDQNYKVQESKTLQTYILNKEPQTVTLQQDEITNITFTNEKKKGSLKIFKVDKDNNKIGIGNVEFDLYSEEFKEIIGTYITDVNGELKIDDLRVGSYKLIEKVTNKWYNLADEKTVEVEWNKISENTIENELKKGQIKVVKVDKDNNEVKLAGVKFDVIDEKGNVLETITTDENGETTTSKYAIRDYEKLTLKETETLEEYVLSEETQTVVLEENQIKTITFENEVKKAQIKVIKVDKDNQEVKLKGVKFNVLDEDGNIVETLITDENGEATTKRLPITEEYTVVETETLQEYKLTEEVQTVTLKQDEIKTLTFENEKRKGQLKIIKVDMNNNEVLLKDVKFEIKDESGNVVETLVTDENGEATTKPLAIDQKYTVVETETQKEYVLTEETKTIELTEDEITNITFYNEKVKGKIEITKISSNDNQLTDETKGALLNNAVFEIYNENDELVDIIISEENGKAISKLLEYGKYYIKEKDTGSDYYLLNTEIYNIEITENLVTVPITIENESVEIGLDIDKTGIMQAQANDEIKYSFNTLKNTSNVAIDNFTWTDNLPYDYIRVTKLFTGTYNEDLDYVVKYKTNKSEDYIEYGTYNTQINNYIDFTVVELEEDEYITDFKIEFGTVMSGFEAVEKPFIFAKVLTTVKAEDKWTNYTNLTGNYKEHKLEDKAEWTTISYKKELEINKLPKTGF